jgi:hypothetical protein
MVTKKRERERERERESICKHKKEWTPYTNNIDKG